MTPSAEQARQVILLHGPPASGKLTIARHLAEQIESVILHNHLTFNLARKLFEIGDPRLVNLHRELRLVMLKHALAPTVAGAPPVPDVILTLVYAEPDSIESLAEIKKTVEQSGARLAPFYLQCSEQTLLKRVDSADRIKEGKLHTPDRLRALLKQNDYPPLPHPNTRVISNDGLNPETPAAEILRLLVVQE